MGTTRRPATLNRRDVFKLAGMGAGALAATRLGPLVAAAQTPVGTPASGRVVEQVLEAAPFTAELGNRTVSTWGYNGGLPGPELRLTEGDTLRVTLRNRLPEASSIHWHGLPIVNAMDGVPGVTQAAVEPGADFVYEFVVPTPGTYMYHTHAGTQLDRGLYGPLIVEPARESLSYDREHVLVLDDWLDGVEGTPDEAFARLRAGGSEMDDMPGMGGEPPADDGGMEGMEGMPGMAPPPDAPPPAFMPDIVYPLYLINGRPADAPAELAVRQGERVRFRILNPGSATIFRVALAGHRMTVVATDGQPVEPHEVDALRVGMGERYDVLVEAGNPGVWQFAAQAEGTQQLARAIVRYDGSTGAPPPPDLLPAELGLQLAGYGALRAIGGDDPAPEQEVAIVLGGEEDRYVWTINGQAFPQADPIAVTAGGRIRFTIDNQSMMPHPMHLHGHFFRVDAGNGPGPRKDTVLVDPQQRIAVDWVADNPGDWAFHCHHTYHAEAGMLRVVRVA